MVADVLKLFFLAILSVFGEEKLYNAYNTQIENDIKEYLVNAKTDYNFNKTLRYAVKENFNYCPRFNTVYILCKLHFNTTTVYFSRREWNC